MPQQTVLFTIMPRGLSINSETLPVSVYVSPRLSGAPRLGHFVDWLQWTHRLREQGLTLKLRSNGNTRAFKIDTAPLRPDLWEALFNEETFVRSFTFDDYTERTIYSYPVRLALSALKSVYQQAGVALGLPDRGTTFQDKERYSPHRQFLKNLLSGLEVDWSQDLAKELRGSYRSTFARLADMDKLPTIRYPSALLAPDGTLGVLLEAGTPASKNLNQFVAHQFAAYTHMPQGAPIADHPPNFEELIDFHQALSSLNSYPDLLRALGLVFDLDLPKEFVAATPPGAIGRLAVIDLPERAWEIETLAPPDMAPIETAYVYFAAGDPSAPWQIFTTAPGLLGGVHDDLQVFGLLNMDPGQYGLAQVDVEGGMHKNILLAESWQNHRLGLAFPEHPEVYDETTTLPSLRSGGFSLFADGRALRLLETFKGNARFNGDLENNRPLDRPFYAEDLIHGYRLDVWDSYTGRWYSLHRRSGLYEINDRAFETVDEEGFTQLAAAQSAPDPDNPPPNDLYLNESVARWAGWSLSVPFPGKALSHDPDPDQALVDDPNHPQNEPATPFKMVTHFTATPKSLPSLRFGRRYRLRVRPVDICGNSLKHDAPLAHLLADIIGLPRDPEGSAYLRFEPIAPPSVVLRDVQAVTAPGSQLERMVMRTFNDDPTKDSDPADLTASDRFITPPSTSVEVGERMGMFDDAAGKLVNNAKMYALIGARDKGRLNHVEVEVAGQKQMFPLESGADIGMLPYLPDVLARGAALRDLPGTPNGSLASVAPGAGLELPVPYALLADANPRPGSATLVSFGQEGDWQKLKPFRLALADGDGVPAWDPQGRVLTMYLPKATQAVVPLSSYLTADDLKLMGVWQWLREYIDHLTAHHPDVPVLDDRLDMEKIAHLLQRALEGGHWMVTPPRLLTLVHAVQQPIGRPEFTAIAAQHTPYGTPGKYGGVDEMVAPDPNVLQTVPEGTPTQESELTPITAWRKPNSEEAYLLGGLNIHAASTSKVDLLAEWQDPFDDLSQPREPDQDYREKHTAQADEIPIPSTQEGTIAAGIGSPNYRPLAYYDADHDLLCFARKGDQLGNLESGVSIYRDTAPRHHLNDTRYHRIAYSARATSRFREYFGQDLDFTRSSEPILVHVPASARPAAPLVNYVLPTFGWQRQTQSNVKRSVRFGGGLRVYLDRPWFSSGDGELLGIVLYDSIRNGALTDREAWGRFITQWGADPIWQPRPGNQALFGLPETHHLSNFAASEFNLSLPGRAPGRVAVAGYPVAFDYDSQKWFADLTVNVSLAAYAPFIRLALVRYQPHALPDAKLSAVVLADFSQLTPERSAVLTADPYHPRRLRLTVSGPAPIGPPPTIVGAKPTEQVSTPTQVTVTLQRRHPAISTDVGWQDAPESVVAISPSPIADPSGLVRWTGTLTLAGAPKPGLFRVLIREYEYLSANYVEVIQDERGKAAGSEPPKRLIYAEALEIDAALIGGPTVQTSTKLEG